MQLGKRERRQPEHIAVTVRGYPERAVVNAIRDGVAYALNYWRGAGEG